MPNYRIQVREINSWHFVVEAESMEDALDAVQEQLDETDSELMEDLSRRHLDDGGYETDGAQQIDDDRTPDYYATYNGLLSYDDMQALAEEAAAT